MTPFLPSFRLNISRLHADWIVNKSKDYATALQFDQLRDILAEPDSCFKGFREAAIAFAPTCAQALFLPVPERALNEIPSSR
jgi:hypothetical protein